MNPNHSAMNRHAACQLLIQEMGETGLLSENLPQAFAQVNAKRLEHTWPMVTSMSCFNPLIEKPSDAPLDLPLKPLRAFWEKGLTFVLKSDPDQGIPQMLACCQPLTRQPGNHFLSQIARTMMSLLPTLGRNHVEVLISLASRYDRLLCQENAIDPICAENLLRDSLFYLSLLEPLRFEKAWTWSEPGFDALQERLRWAAKALADLLYPQEDEDKIDKSMIEKNLVPVTDALLFLNEISLRTRLILRMEKIENRMLKIAVPVQLLMAEALRLAL